jgi:hypothetical protein
MKWIILAALGVVLFIVYRKLKRLRQERFIKKYAFPKAIPDKIIKHYPHLSPDQVERVMYGLREYFAICNIAGRRMISMPSQVVDVAWHEFILFTRSYELFCNKGLGRFLHHTPAEAMSTPQIAQEGIKRVWRLSCLREGLDPKNTLVLPTLFALDAELKIPDGFEYVMNCTGADGKQVYCAGHIGCGGGCSSGCAGDSGGGDSSCGAGCGGD